MFDRLLDRWCPLRCGRAGRVVNWVRGSTSSCLRAFARAFGACATSRSCGRTAPRSKRSCGGRPRRRWEPVEPRSGGVLEIRLDGRTTWVHRQEVALDPAVTLRASLEKSLAHEFLAAAGISIPDHLLCDVHRLGPALGFLRETPRAWWSSRRGDRGRDRHHRQCPHRAAAAQSGAPRLTQDPAGARRGARARPRSPAAVPGRRTARCRPARAAACRRRRLASIRTLIGRENEARLEAAAARPGAPDDHARLRIHSCRGRARARFGARVRPPRAGQGDHEPGRAGGLPHRADADCTGAAAQGHGRGGGDQPPPRRGI